MNKKNTANKKYCFSKALASLMALFFTAACTSTPPPPVQTSQESLKAVVPEAKKVTLKFEIAENLNFYRGRARNLRIRVYQLQATHNFNVHDYISIVENEKQALQGDVVEHKDFFLKPGQAAFTEVITLNSSTRALGFIAHYAEIENGAKWQASYSVTKQGYSEISVLLSDKAITIQ